MAVYISCPVCSVTVLVLPGGSVATHGRKKKCSFTKTAGSGSAPEIGSHAKKSPRKKVVARSVIEPSSNPQVTKRTKSFCVGCKRKIKYPIGSPIPAHMTRTGAWCSVGGLPTEAQMEAAEELRARREAEEKLAATQKKKVIRKKAGKGSVWTVRGGLPGLGKR